MKLLAPILTVLLINGAKTDETYENSTDLCGRCSCKSTKNFILDCTRQNFNHMIAEWPAGSANRTTLIASFAYNNITTLETLPSTDATLEIVLSYCGIRYMHPGVFDGTQNVKLIDLSHNSLTAEEISSDKFKGPYSNAQYEPIAVEHLNLAYNKIHSLNKNFFEHMPKLTELNLEGNDFTMLDIHTQLALASITGLYSLNMANNELTEMIDDAIANHDNLTVLNLGKNSLDFVPSSLIKIKSSLEVLILDDNPIIELNDQSFLGLSKIVELSLNNLTELKYVNANTFVPTPKLKKLSLANNLLLRGIDPEAFAPNQTLDEFHLSNSRLYRIDYKLMQWSKLRVFDFKENPLMCSCDLYNITTDLAKDIVRDEDGPFCFHPVLGRSVRVFYLKSDICSIKPYLVVGARYVTHHFTVLRIAMVALSVTLLLAAFVALVLGYTRYRRLQRNRNYPFASQVLYNPLSSGGPTQAYRF